VVVASQADFKNLVRVIEKLDIQRRQVFIEAVIMEVDLDRQTQFGVSLHQGYTVNTNQGQAVGIVGTKYTTSGVPPSFSLTNLASYGGFLAGLQGPTIPAFSQLGSTSRLRRGAARPPAELGRERAQHAAPPHQRQRGGGDHVGQNVPFQAGFAPQLPTGTGTTLPAARWRARARCSEASARTTRRSTGRTSS
jgi:general secretion pathway protein D